ncbi:hypothetical protein Avbf_08761, partial [Armadillidium vulgare]
LMDIATIGVYYGTDTVFNSQPAGDHFGQVVIIGGLVGTLFLICLSFAIDIDNKYTGKVVWYDVFWMFMYFIVETLAMCNWADEGRSTRKLGGLAVSLLCFLNCGVLTLHSLAIIRNNS